MTVACETGRGDPADDAMAGERADTVAAGSGRVPAGARMFGYAGLLPQLAALLVLLLPDQHWHYAALSLAYAYAALILIFLGGLWWGLAAREADRAPRWAWAAAVVPSLIALASAIPWAIGEAWPGPSLILLGASLIGSLLVDRRLVRRGLAPDWWMALRVPLSLGLGLLSLVISVVPR